MDLTVLKRKISTYRSEGGKLRNVSDELLMEILQAWEQWTGPASGFYKEVGVDFRKMAAFIGKAKKLKQDGFGISEFKEIQLASEENLSPKSIENGPCSGAEVVWNDGRVIRFSQVDLLLEFLKKAS